MEKPNEIQPKEESKIVNLVQKVSKEEEEKNLNQKPLNITFENWDPIIKEDEREYQLYSSQNMSQKTLGADLSSVNEYPKPGHDSRITSGMDFTS